MDATLDRSLDTHKDAFKLQASSWNLPQRRSDASITLWAAGVGRIAKGHCPVAMPAAHGYPKRPTY